MLSKNTFKQIKTPIYIGAFLLYTVLTSCTDIKDLYGTWIMAYYPDEKPDSSHVLYGYEDSFNTWTFEDDKLYTRGFKYLGGQGTFSNLELRGNKLVDTKSESPWQSTTINKLPQDRILINHINMGSSQRKVYKRLADSLKNTSEKFDLTGKTYLRNFKTWTDTVQFVNDSVFVSHAWKMGRGLRWERVNVNGFDILFTDIYPPFVLKKKVGNKIYVSTFDRKKEDYILEEINYDKVLQYND